MGRLDTEYLHLKLASPVIMGSSPLTGTLDNLKKAEDNGAGAVVVRSLFEELIVNETRSAIDSAAGFLTHSDAESFLEGASRDFFIDRYLKLVQDAKKALGIPVIASICCNSQGAWVEYAKRFEYCGADALELNYYILASDSKVSGNQVEKMYRDLISAARKAVSIPLSIKIGYQFSSLSNMIQSFSEIGIDGIVLFNHFVRPDIDLDNVRIDARLLYNKMNDFSETLRWIALMSAETKTDFAASTGIRDSSVVLKMLLAGARCCQLATAVYENGFEVIGRFNSEIARWMERHEYSSIKQFMGLLAQERIMHPEQWERSQYIKHQEKQ